MKRFLERLLAVLCGLLLLSLGAVVLIGCQSEPPATDTTEDLTAPPVISEQPTDPVQTDPIPVETETLSETAPMEDPALNVFPAEGENIEIGIFWEPPAEFTTPEQYDWIRDAHITFIEATNHRGNIDHEVAQKQVALAAERGIKVSYGPGRDGKNLASMSDEEIIAYIQELAQNPAISGVHVIDEPANPWAYGRICAAVKQGGLNPRLNFLPYFATWVFENYTGHVEDTIIATGKENYGFLCYDQYPFPYNGGDPDMWYNLDLFRQIGLKYGVETGFYLQSIGEAGNFRRTNGHEIRYHSSAALAYGLTSLTYFTWWTTGFCDEKDYAIISPYGEKTDIYDDVAEINSDILKVGTLIRRLDALEVYHTDRIGTHITTCEPDEVPMYAKPQKRYGFIVSLMEDPETGRDYIMLVNKNYKTEVTAEFTVSDAVTYLYNCTNGAYEPVDISEKKVTLTFKPGAFMLFAVGQHDNIVNRTLDQSENLAEGKAPSVQAVNPGNGYYAYAVTDGIRDNSTPQALGYRSPTKDGYVEVDLGRVLTINRVDLYPTGTEYTRGETFPTAFAIEISSDGRNWQTVVEKEGYTDARKAIPSFTFDDISARYVRFTVKDVPAGNSWELAEMEIYRDDGSIPAPENDRLYKIPGGEPAGTNVALEKSVTASSHVAGWEPITLTNGSWDSGWTSGLNRHATKDGTEWVLIDLSYTYLLDRVVLVPRSGDGYFPVQYRIEVSEDGENFTNVYEGTLDEQRSGQKPIECKLDENVKGRYVRITGYVLRDAVGFGDGFLFSMMEVEIYNR